MQKVTAFLEQHVQWVAIGLGALFCLFMIYSYVITPPAEVKIGNEWYGPSEIDPHTASTVAAKLQTAMQNTSKIKMEVPQYVQAFQNKMTWQDAQPVKLALRTDPSYSLDVPLPTAPAPPPGVVPLPDPNNPNQQQPPGPMQKIAALPVPPQPKYSDVKYGRSVIVPPPAPGQAAPAVQPGVVPPNAIDKDWVTQMWTVSMPEIETAFKNAGINKLPPNLRMTQFLQVEMVREELVNGQPTGKEVPIPHNGPTRTNVPMMAWPGDKPDPSLAQAQFQYITWATTMTPDIIQPLFHATVVGKGDQWTKPGPLLAGAGQMFNPELFVGDPNTLPADQKDAVMKARQRKHRQMLEEKKKNTPRPTRPPPGGRGPGGIPPDTLDGADGMNYAPQRRSAPPTARPLPHYAPAPARPYPPGRGGYGIPPDVMEMEGDMGFGSGGAPQAPGLPQPGTDYPNGEFDLTDAAQVAQQPWRLKNVEVWAHDDTVEAGKTYRYKMRYKLKNPIFRAANAAAPELVNQFALISPWSEWTTSITVPSLVNFFVAGGVVANRGTVDFEIFRWDQGMQKLERFTLGPGDMVGWPKNGIDFSTDWTVVDLRGDPRTSDPQILLVNNKDGTVIARSFSTDRDDKLYKALKAQVKAANDAAAAAAGTVGAAGTAGAVIPPGNGTAAAR